jgi:hypothetical protein
LRGRHLRRGDHTHQLPCACLLLHLPTDLVRLHLLDLHLLRAHLPRLERVQTLGDTFGGAGRK